MESILCLLGYLLLVWDSRHIRPDAADLFRVFSGHIAYVPSAMTRRPSARFSESELGRRFLSGCSFTCRTRRWSEPGLAFGFCLGVSGLLVS